MRSARGLFCLWLGGLRLQLRNLILRQEVGHALEADADGGEVVQHGRRSRLQDAQRTQRDEGRVEGEHEAIVGVHALLQGVGDGLEHHQFLQAVGLDGHVCDLAGDGGTGVDGNADVGSGQGCLLYTSPSPRDA